MKNIEGEEHRIGPEKPEEELEKLDNIELDPYLKQLRQNEQLEREKKEETIGAQVRQTSHEASVERLKLQVTDALEKDSTLGSEKEAFPKGKKVLIDTKNPNRSRTNKSWLRRSITAGSFLLASLFGAGKEANAANPEDSIRKDTRVTAIAESKNGKYEIRALSPQEMQEWNMFVDFVESEGKKGSKELDTKSTALARTLFEAFKQKHPGISITLSPDFVASVQAAMHGIRETTQQLAKRKEDPNAENIMAGISKIDGWPGSKTTQYKFPSMQLEQYHNEQLKSKTYLGLVDGSMAPASMKKESKRIPPGVKIEKLDGGDYYEDPQTGDLVKIK